MICHHHQTLVYRSLYDAIDMMEVMKYKLKIIDENETYHKFITMGMPKCWEKMKENREIPK